VRRRGGPISRRLRSSRSNRLPRDRGIPSPESLPNLRLDSLIVTPAFNFGNEIYEVVVAEPPYIIGRFSEPSDGAPRHDPRRHFADVRVQCDFKELRRHRFDRTGSSRFREGRSASPLDRSRCLSRLRRDGFLLSPARSEVPRPLPGDRQKPSRSSIRHAFGCADCYHPTCEKGVQERHPPAVLCSPIVRIFNCAI
jgi:hypothetical protein